MHSEACKSLGVLPRHWRWTFHVWNLETSLTSVVSGCGSMTHIFAQLREITVFFSGCFLVRNQPYFRFHVRLSFTFESSKRTALQASMAIDTSPFTYIDYLDQL